MDTQDGLMLSLAPTDGRPLLGVTILLVEDSRFAAEGLRQMCVRSGARIRRADSLASARKHLRVYRPTIVLVDMTLPDGSGSQLILEMAGSLPRIEAILAISGDPGARDPALAAGADGFLVKPVARLSTFQSLILAHLPKERQPLGPRPLSDERIAPDLVAYRDDLNHAAHLLEPGRRPADVDYLTQFLGGVARSAGDTALGEAVMALAASGATGVPPQGAIDVVAALVRSRIAAPADFLGSL